MNKIINSNKDNLYIILRETDIKKVSINKNNYFSLCPYLDNKNCLNIKYPNPLETSRKSNIQFLEGQNIVEELIKTASKPFSKENKSLIRELLKPYLDLKVSIYLYLKDTIPEFPNYLLKTKGRWKRFNTITSLIIGIENEYLKDKGNIYSFLGRFKIYNYTFIQKLLGSLQVKLLKRIFRNKKLYILSCKKSYFMPKIYSHLKKDKKNIIIYSQSQDLKNIIFIIIQQIISIFKKKVNIDNPFFLIPELNKEKIKLNVSETKNKLPYIDKEYFLNLLDDIERYLNLSIGYKSYIYKLFKDSESKDINAILHTNRFPDLNSLSQVFSNLGGQQHLISHGTHTLQIKNEKETFVSENLSLGMLETSIPGVNIYSQSKLANAYLSKKNKRYRKIKPIGLIDKKKIKLSSFNILCAGTIKPLGARRNYFESSFEYIYGIEELCRKIKNLNLDIKISLRIRDVPNEMNPRILKKIESKFHSILKISDHKDLAYDISQSNCLLALSSTTLEEGINYEIPVMSYGLSTYNHFKYYENSEFRIDKKIENYTILKKIEEVLNRNFFYFNKTNNKEKSIFDFLG